ncbi:hypothetical protein D3C80_1987360 [compost metagenome]
MPKPKTRAMPHNTTAKGMAWIRACRPVGLCDCDAWRSISAIVAVSWATRRHKSGIKGEVCRRRSCARPAWSMTLSIS